jgi:hypothetical protein
MQIQTQFSTQPAKETSQPASALLRQAQQGAQYGWLVSLLP